MRNEDDVGGMSVYVCMLIADLIVRRQCSHYTVVYVNHLLVPRLYRIVLASDAMTNCENDCDFLWSKSSEFYNAHAR